MTEYPGLRVDFTTDPQAFLDAADVQLAADPVVTTVVATVTSRYAELRAAGEPPPTDRPEWWAVVRDDEGAVAGLAMRTARTPPHPLFVLPMADDAALALARALHARGETVGGLNGSLPSAEVCAAELAGLQGDRVEVAQHTRLFELAQLVAPVGVPGGLRAATPDDLDLAVDWVGRFMHDADVQAGRDPAAHGREVIEPEDLARRIEGGTYWFWLDEAGERVHLTGANPPAFGVARIGPVYTPPKHRRQGYAGAAVAEVSQHFLDAGARVCLYTDQANPTSNGIYQALGYVAVVDQVNLRIVGGS
jgi:GNAT superfamily N-acetyltransferase